MSLLRRRRDAKREAPKAEEADAVLVARARENLDAFAPLYHRYRDFVRFYSLQKLRDRDKAEDATSQIFEKAMRALPRYRETGSFRAWLITLAHHELCNTLRTQRPSAPIETAWAIPDSAPSPEDRTAAALDLATINAAIACLAEDDRDIINLRSMEFTGKEIAEILNISLDAAKKRQVRAVDRLEAVLLTTAQRTGERDAR